MNFLNWIKNLFKNNSKIHADLESNNSNNVDVVKSLKSEQIKGARMGKQLDVDKARRILPANAIAGVAELNSNFTVYVAEVNPGNAGDSVEPVDCGSVAEVAEQFKPKIEFQIKKLNKIGNSELEEEVVSATMNYGEQPKEIMNDFKADNLVVKMETQDNEKILLDQQLTYLALDDLQERLRDQKFAKLMQSDKQSLIDALEQEIERIKNLKEKSDLASMTND
jgi:hypothetical protein